MSVFLLLFGQLTLSLSDKIGCMIFAMFVFIKYSTNYVFFISLPKKTLVHEIDKTQFCSETLILIWGH